MKRILAVIVFLLLFALPARGVEWCNSSGDLTADSLVMVGSGSFYGLGVTTDGVNAVTVSIYDSATAATGKLLFPTFVVPVSPATGTLNINPPVRFENGLYIDITCGGTVHYVVYYSR